MDLSKFTPEFLALGGIWYLAFLFSTVCHEAAHALAAKLGGDTTASEGGQASLNPLPHIMREPIGILFAFLTALSVSADLLAADAYPTRPVRFILPAAVGV